MKMKFKEVFTIYPDGTLIPIVPICIGPVVMPPGSRLKVEKGSSIGGIDLASLQGKDLDIEVRHGMYVVKGPYMRKKG